MTPDDGKLQSLLPGLSDDELLHRLSAILQQSRRVEAVLIAHIDEVDHRSLVAREACSSMFIYCTDVLNLSESEAYFRITVARASRSHPMLLEMLADGRLHVSGIAKLAPHLTETNRDSVLARAAHQSKRQIEELVAELSPKPDVPSTIRKLPQQAPRPMLQQTQDPATQLVPDRVASPVKSAPRPAPKPEALRRARLQQGASGPLSP